MEFLNNGMHSVGCHKYVYMHILCRFFLVNYFAWPHTGNGRGRDVLPMLYAIPIHN